MRQPLTCCTTTSLFDRQNTAQRLLSYNEYFGIRYIYMNTTSILRCGQLIPMLKQNGRCHDTTST